MPNQVRLTASFKDDASKPADTLRGKFELLQKAGGKGLAIGASAAVTAKGLEVMGNVVGMVSEKVLQFGADSLNAASNLNESMSLSKQVFEDNADAVSAWGDTAAEEFGQSKREALDFASNFGNAFKNVGFSLDETMKKSEAMTHLAADLGSAFNASSEEAATALRSGLLGESEPLRRFGVFLSEAAVQAKAAAMGMKPLNGALSDGQKVAARYAIIMEQTADSQGMFGRDTNSLADSQKALAAEVENLQAEIGAELMPVVRDLSKWAKDEGVPALRDLLAVSKELGPVFSGFAGGGITDVIHGAHQAADETEDLTGRLEGVVDAAQSFTVVGQAVKLLGLNSHEAAADVEVAVQGILGDVGQGRHAVVKDTALMGGAFADFASDAVDAKRTVIDAFQAIAHKARSTRDELNKIGQEAADALFDPTIVAAELAENRVEQSALRKIAAEKGYTEGEIEEAKKQAKTEAQRLAASKMHTKAEVADAKLRLKELQKDAFERQVALIGYGKLNKKEQAAFLADLKKKWKSETGEAKADIAALIAYIEGLNKNANLSISVRQSSKSGDKFQFAKGGVAGENDSAIVGEAGKPELVEGIPGGGFKVTPLAADGWGYSSGPSTYSAPSTSGGDIHIHVSTPLMTPGAAQALAAALAPHMTRWQQQRGLVPR